MAPPDDPPNDPDARARDDIPKAYRATWRAPKPRKRGAKAMVLATLPDAPDTEEGRRKVLGELYRLALYAELEQCRIVACKAYLEATAPDAERDAQKPGDPLARFRLVGKP